MCDLARRVLRRTYELSIHEDPVGAMVALLDAPRVDAVLCDVMMGPLSGQELHARVVAERPDLASRFLFMTGGATSDGTRRFLDAQPPGRVLLKPFSATDLEDAMSRLLSEQAAPSTPQA
jgi:DNA-binding NarL/FixJ family response regulator